MNILEEIAGKTRERIDQEKGKVSVAELKETGPGTESGDSSDTVFLSGIEKRRDVLYL